MHDDTQIAKRSVQGFAGPVRGLVWMSIAAACSGGGTGSSLTSPGSQTPVVPVLTTLTVSLSANTIAPRQVSAASASGFDQNGSPISLSGVTWSSSSTSIATVSASGAVTAVTPGQAQIVASVGTKQGQASLTVAIPPVLTSQPKSVIEHVDSSATFNVVATSTLPLTYQWLRNNVPIFGATSTTYFIPAVSRADSAALFSVVISNAVGTDTSFAAILTVTGAKVYGLSGFTPTVDPTARDIVGVQFRVLVVEDASPTVKILFGGTRLGVPGSNVTYLVETNVYSDAFAYANGVCTAFPLQGVETFGQSSLRFAIADYPLTYGIQQMQTTGLRSGDPTGWPVQSYLVDNIATLPKSDAISQVSQNGVETLITIQREAVTYDPSLYVNCGRSLRAGAYRRWSLSAASTLGTTVVEVVAPDSLTRYLDTYEMAHIYSEFLHTNGALAVQYWNFAYKRESNPAWIPISSFTSNANYDGNGTDFGIHLVTVNGQTRIEFRNRPGKYFLRGQAFLF